VTELLEELSFAEPSVLRGQFDYKMKDIKSNLKESVKVSLEYHDGKFDPKLLMAGSSKPKKK
jgi:hypothetical protein